MRAVWHIFLAGLGAAAIAAAAGAQDAVYFDDTFGNPGPAPTLPHDPTGVDYRIDSTRGTVNGGSQLFFSFLRFGIPAGDAATFTGPDSIDFIFARVTGLAMSEIDGLLRSEVGDAGLFVLNPNGVIFGPDARLEVGGSFHVSTADVLRFDKGQNFEAYAGGAIPIAVAPVTAFGFLDDGGVPATIRFDGTTREKFSAAAGKTLSAIAGRIEIDGRGPLVETATLGSVGGVLQLAAVPAGSEVPADLANFTTDGLASTDAAIQLTDNAIVEVSGNGPDGGARVVIRGGRFEMVSKDGARSGRVTASGSGASPGDPAAAIDIEVAGALSVDFGTINGVARSLTKGVASGDIHIAGGSISLVNGSKVRSEIESAAQFVNGPDIRVNAGDLSVASGSSIISLNAGPLGTNTGNVGDICVDANAILVTGANSEIATRITGSGDGSTLHIHSATSLELKDGARIRSERVAGIIAGGTPDTPSRIEILAKTLSATGDSKILSRTATAFDGASIQIGSETEPVETISVNAGSIGSETNGSGKGGGLTIHASRILLSSNPDIPNLPGQLSSVTSSGGLGGNLDVFADSINATAGSIGSQTTGIGKGGDVTVHAGQILLASDPDIPNSTGQLSAITAGAGPGGNLNVFADSIDLIDGGQMSTSTSLGAGRAGDLTAEVTGRLFASGTTTVGATPVSSGLFSRGVDADGGNLKIHADSIELERGADLSTSIVVPKNAGADVGTGKPGDMLLTARAISVTGAAGTTTSIAAKSKDGEGEGGDLTIDSDTLAVTAGGEITTSTTGKRDAGNLLITAREISVNGTDAFGNNISGITSRSLQNSTGRAGSVTLRPHDGERLTLQIGDRGRASVESKGFGAGGDLLISGAELIEVSGGGEISASVGDVFTDDPGGRAAVAGDIRIRDTDTLRISSGGQITAATSGLGFGGSIDIQADQVDLSGGAKITASSEGAKAGAGDAGAIVIAAADTFSATNSEITTTAIADDAGGGRISIQARDLVYFVDSLVETTVSGKTAGADAGDIFIPLGGEEALGVDPVVPGFVVINRSIIRANAEASGAGDITIDGANVLISTDSLIEATSVKGVSGEIQISAPDADVASQVAVLPSSFVDPSDRLLPPCVARTERTGSFMVQNRGAIPRSPDAPLPSTLGGAPGVDGIPPANGATDCSVFPERS